MAPISLKIVLDEGMVTRTVKFNSTMKVSEAYNILEEKLNVTEYHGKEYGLFLTSADNELSGIWLESDRTLDYYMLRDGDSLLYLCKMRNLRVKTLDDSVKTVQVNEARPVGELMMTICHRIGLTNHDEYGLCREEVKESEEAKSTGTLTLKRKPQQREKDAKLEQLSKKLKTDDNVEWLDQRKTFREIGVHPTETLLLKRRLFYSDRRVDARDPVQLNLLYVQTKDAILEGRHPVTEKNAVEFAGIQCQIQYGDFDENKHKSGFIENQSEFLPEQYVGSWGIEKKIFAEHKKHKGTSSLDAKYVYIKTAREMPTYGVTFFLVKEKQKGKKKLVPRLLGINSESILRLDEVTKEILQVWPLTQVKTYHAGKTETFTLNFGDYSEKEYCVKTNDAYRIRDILEGYIDIIRKRLAGPFNMTSNEGGMIVQEDVQCSKANTIEHVSNNPMKIVEQSFVGPSKILPTEHGATAFTGTQITTIQKVIISDMVKNQQRVMTGEVPMRADMSMNAVRKLNRMNSNSVKIVTLLTEPTEENIQEVKKIIATIQADLPDVEKGVKETADKQVSDEAKKKLLDELNDLLAYIATMSKAGSSDAFNPSEVEDTAKNIADLSTQMYFSLDPQTRRRSALVRRSRESFIEDEKTSGTLQQAGFIAAAASACRAAKNARVFLDQPYEGEIPKGRELEELEGAAVDKLGKLNAAVALFLDATADSKNVDYSTTKSSMNTIVELMPELVNDVKAISATRDGKSSQAMLDEMRDLCDVIKKISMFTGADDHKKMQTASNEYADASGRLIYTLRRHVGPDDKENEILELAKDVGNKTSILLVKANELVSVAESEPGAEALDTAGGRCADAARDLLSCAQMTAPSIHEPHCQSALTASAEALSSSAQSMALMWKPLVEDPSRHKMGDELRHHAIELAKALDRLKDAYSNLGDDVEMSESQTPERKRQRLKFIASMNAARDAMKDVDNQMKQIQPGPVPPLDASEAAVLQNELSQRIAQLNAALASLLAASNDRKNPDFDTMELAAVTISQLMPDIIKDSRTLALSNEDEAARAAMLRDVRALCDAARHACAGTEDGQCVDIDPKAAREFANTSGKLLFAINPKANPRRTNQIKDASEVTCKHVRDMLANCEQLAQSVGGTEGAILREEAERLAKAMQGFHTAVQLTAPSIEEPRCQSVLLSSADKLSSSARDLASAWMPLAQRPEHRKLGDVLAQSRRQLEAQLDRLRDVCKDGGNSVTDDCQIPAQKHQRLKFVASANAARDAVRDAEKQLEQNLTPGGHLIASQADALQSKLSQNMAQLNAAIAALLASSADHNKPDYYVMDQAVDDISKLMPVITKDSRTLAQSSADKGARDALLADVRALCAAVRAVCASVEDEQHGEVDPTSARELANASEKLFYVFKPSANPRRENQIKDASKATCKNAGDMLANCEQLAQSVEGTEGAALREEAERLAKAMQGFHTTVQLTAPSIEEPRCQSVLLSSADVLSSSARDLASVWTPITQRPEHRHLGNALAQSLQQLEAQLDRLRDACRHGGNNECQTPGQKKQHMKFVATANAARDALKDAEKQLEQQHLTPGSHLSAPQADALQSKLSQNMAQLNAAIAALLASSAGHNKPDYYVMDQAVADISKLMPVITKDSRTLAQSNADKGARDALLGDVRALCAAVRAVCASAVDEQHGDVDSTAAREFANASGKLLYVFNPSGNPRRESQIKDVSEVTCKNAKSMLANCEQLAKSVGGTEGTALREEAERLAKAMQGFHTTVQLTAPTIEEPRCQSVLLSSADDLSSSARDVASVWMPLVHRPEHRHLGYALAQSRRQLEAQLDRLRDACKDGGNIVTGASETPGQKHQRLKFITRASAARDALRDAEKQLEQQHLTPGGHLSAPQAAALQSKLSLNMAQLNAAIAALLTANADHNKPDYHLMEQAATDISELMPQIINDSSTLALSNKDEAARDAMLRDVRALCDAARNICASAGNGSLKDLNLDVVNKFANSSGKLSYAFNPSFNDHREEQIRDVSESACKNAADMLGNCEQLAHAVGGPTGVVLRDKGQKLTSATQAFQTAAQLTGSSINEPRCQSVLLTSADELSLSARDLATVWMPLVQHPEHKKFGVALAQNREELEKQLERLRDACIDNSNIVKSPKRKAPPVPIRSDQVKVNFDEKSPSGTNAKVVAHTGATPKQIKDINQEFLDKIRRDEIHAETKSQTNRAVPTKSKPVPPPKKMGEQERKLQETQFGQSIANAEKELWKAEEDMNKACDSYKGTSQIDSEQSLVLRKQIEEKLAKAAVAVSSLVAANGLEGIHYAKAIESTNSLSAVTPNIAKDAKILGECLDDKQRKELLKDTKALCEASRNVCGTMKKDRKNLNEFAVEFGNKSAKILYAISTDVDPGQEREVIARAKAIGDSVSALAQGGARAASGADDAAAQRMCGAGTACADAAGTLVYTAKLVAPSIQDPDCQKALTNVVDDLSSHLKTFSSTWTPLSSNPIQAKCITEMTSEADKLQKLLEDLKQDLRAGKLVRKREKPKVTERLLIEDTPMRNLAKNILEDVKANSSKLSPEQKRAVDLYCKKLENAIKAVDIANAKCHNSPNDMAKRNQFENAVQNLQQLVLQERPCRGTQPQNNIVDLTDYIKDVSSKAEDMMEATNSTNNKDLKEKIKGECHAISVKAFKLTNCTKSNDFGDKPGIYDIAELELFGQDCDQRIQKVKSDVESFDEKEPQNVLREKLMPLVESCHLLRFAMKSAESTALGAELDETLNDLTELGEKIDKMLQPTEGNKRPKYTARTCEGAPRAHVAKAAAAAARGEARGVAPALTRYIAEMRSRADLTDPVEKDKLGQHLNKLIQLLKAQTAESGRRVANWQSPNGGNMATITDQIIQELNEPSLRSTATKAGTQNQSPIENAARKLLIPTEELKIIGGQKQLEDNLHKFATKLNSVSRTIVSSAKKPESLMRSVQATTDVAMQLNATAKALADDDTGKCKRIEEAGQEMSFAVYNLLTTAESVSHDPNSSAARRRLMDACRLLNDSINKLVRTSLPADNLQTECGELTRRLQLNLYSEQTPRSTGPLPYSDCVDALNNQRDIIQKMDEEQPMSRKEFGKALHYVVSAVSNTAEYSEQCAYLLSISEQDKDIAMDGLIDIDRLHNLTDGLQDTCFRIMRSGDIGQAKEEEITLSKQVQDIQQAIQEAGNKTKDTNIERELMESGRRVNDCAKKLHDVLHEANANVENIVPSTITLLDAVGEVNSVIENPVLVPKVTAVSPEVQKKRDEVMQNSRDLVNKTLELIREVNSSEDEEPMTWVMFNNGRKGVKETFEALLKVVRENGHHAGLIQLPQSEVTEEGPDTPKKSYLQIQVDLANKWLKTPTSKPEIKTTGQNAVKYIIEMAEKTAEDMKGSEKEEIHYMTNETQQLLDDCSTKYDQEKSSVLMERMNDLRKIIERGVVTRVVEDFIQEEEPLQDLEILADAEKDEAKRKFLLEKKIAELLAQLGRVTKTARLVADSNTPDNHTNQELSKCSDQAELLAPLLVQAAQQRIGSPNDKAVVENYKSILTKYAEALSKIRQFCDQAVDPMDFAQTAGETMQRMMDESNDQDDLHKCAYTASAINSLANRVVQVGMSSRAVRGDPELQHALRDAQRRLSAAQALANARASKQPDWRTTTAEIMRTTGEVESALGGEMIFKKQPEPDQPIYNAALNLHAAVRDWSARDNEIVAVAKRMAVLMARLSDYMNTNRSRDVIAASKSIVIESHEVTKLARKLALECTDVRIKTNLLQVCDRIPTISGQLKMLTTVKGSSLGQQSTFEDEEAMNMLVGNAQNLMLSIQEVVKAAAGASVKIQSQRRGPRMRWVRRVRYY